MRRYFVLGIGGILLILAGSILFMGGHNAQCSVASAQDNPCLEQEATNSALQLEVFSAQATSNAVLAENSNLQATITALEAGSAITGTTPNTTMDCEAYPITETFDDNTRGILTISQEGGRARVVDGVLEVRFSGDEDRLFVPLPGICAESNFYAEVTMQVLDTGKSSSLAGNFGLAVGNASQEDYHVFSIGVNKTWMIDIAGQTVNDTLIRSSYDNLIPDDGMAVVVLGLEGRNGIVTMFVNGQEFDALPIPFKGNQFAVYMGFGTPPNFAGATITFDDVVIPSAR
jgi:hypothetical protein